MKETIISNLNLGRIEGNRKAIQMSPILSSKIVQTGKHVPELSHSDEYELIIKIGVSFWANRAQLESCTEIAIKTFRNRIYGGILSDLCEIMLSASNNDRYKTMELVHNLMSELEGQE